MSTDTDRDNGRFEEKVPDNDILLVFERASWQFHGPLENALTNLVAE